MSVDEILNDIAIWSEKKTEICQNVNPMFVVAYSKFSNAIEMLLDDNNLNLSSIDGKAYILDRCVNALLVDSYDEKDYAYYALIAVLYDSINMGF